MQNRIVAILVKRGFNRTDAEKMTTTYISTATRMFPDAKAGKLAEVISCL